MPQFQICILDIHIVGVKMEEMKKLLQKNINCKNEQKFAAAKVEAPAHAAALGVHFYRGTMFPEQYRNLMFIAEHGSWNRRTLTGYRIQTVETFGAYKYNTFANFLTKTSFGRPVDITEMKDGSLLISDDYSNKIYRITYNT